MGAIAVNQCCLPTSQTDAHILEAPFDLALNLWRILSGAALSQAQLLVPAGLPSPAAAEASQIQPNAEVQTPVDMASMGGHEVT